MGYLDVVGRIDEVGFSVGIWSLFGGGIGVNYKICVRFNMVVSKYFYVVWYY